MFITRTIITVILAILFFPVAGFADQSIKNFAITPSLKEASLGTYMDILEDREGRYGVNDLSDPDIARQFVRSDREEPSFGFTDSVYWVRLSVENQSDAAVKWYLELIYPLIDSVHIYIPAADGQYLVRCSDWFGCRRFFLPVYRGSTADFWTAAG